VQDVCCFYFKKFQSSALLQKPRLPTAVNISSDEVKHESVNDGHSAQKIARYLSALVHERISVANCCSLSFNASFCNKLVFIAAFFGIYCCFLVCALWQKLT